MKYFNFLILLLVFTAFGMVACSKDGDDGNPEEQTLPQNREEAISKIEGKWNLSSSGDVSSVEFIADGTYILEVSAGSGLLPVAGTGQGRNFVSRSGGQRAALVAQGGATGTVSTVGTYTVSTDGKTITLEGIATITITALTDANFSFSITFTEVNKTVNVALNVAPTVPISDKTNLLARTWVYRDWPSTFEPDDITELTNLGLKLHDMKFIFTKSGTFIMPVLETWVNKSIPPEDPSQPTPPDEYGYSLNNLFAVWEWKDSQQNTLLLTTSDDFVQLQIIQLTDNALKFFPGVGDNETADLVPLP